jgi:23S rRNA (adenine2503-C2)-methyltransferase
LGFQRSLKAAEITEQFLYLSDIVRAKEDRRISNIVVMGMGEPLLNLDALRTALDILCDKSGINCSGQRITVSTSGINKGILDMAENGPDVKLALSLTSARESLRNRLMPGVQGNPLAETKKALQIYQKKQGRRITLEFVLLRGINTGEEEVRSLAAFAAGLSVVINLIPWNPVAGLQFEGKSLQKPEEKEIETFRALLEQRGLAVTRRYRRGRSISGACGQLGVVCP